MKYLLYYRDGFIKKFPLNKSELIIGRSPENDLVINEDYISRRHLNIKVKEDCIKIQDLDSTNGVYVEGCRVKESTINIGESFFIKGTSFVLRDGSLEEFKLAKELIPVFDHIKSDDSKTPDTTKTKYVKNIFNELLKHILAVGLKKSDFHEFMLDIASFLNVITDFGSIFLASMEENDINVILSIKKESKVLDQFKAILKKVPHLFEDDQDWQPIPDDKENYFSAFTLKINGKKAVLIYIPNNPNREENSKVENFLLSFAKEIALLSQIMHETSISKKIDLKAEEKFSFEKIVAADPQMQNLINRQKKSPRATSSF